MLKLCEQKQVPVIVNSDAHDPSQVGHLELAAELLEEAGFPSALVLNNDRDKLVRFLKD
jgi:putative hydrolase